MSLMIEAIVAIFLKRATALWFIWILASLC